MTHNATAPVDAEQSKFAAHAIKKRFDELNTPIKLNHAYEALAIAHRYPNWATMKASFQTEKPSRAAPLAQFKYGCSFGKDPEIIACPATSSLRHVHAFSASAAARSDLLVGLARNPIENDAALVFFHAVGANEDPSGVMIKVMNKAVNASRRRDFFVLDASRENSRLGNSCNILEAADSPEQIADLFLAGGWVDHLAASLLTVRGILIVAARHALRLRTLCVTMTSDVIVKVIREIQSGVLELSKAEAEECNYRGDRAFGELLMMIAMYVERQTRQYPMLFDGNAQWSGPQAAVENGQIVVILLSQEGNGNFVDVVGEIAVAAVKRALARRSTARGFPDMIVFNDVAGIRADFFEETTLTNGVVFCVGDQCPTPPSAFADRVATYRSFPGEHDPQPRHYLEKDGEEVGVHTIWE